MQLKGREGGHADHTHHLGWAHDCPGTAGRRGREKPSSVPLAPFAESQDHSTYL